MKYYKEKMGAYVYTNKLSDYWLTAFYYDENKIIVDECNKL